MSISDKIILLVTIPTIFGLFMLLIVGLYRMYVERNPIDIHVGDLVVVRRFIRRPNLGDVGKVLEDAYNKSRLFHRSVLSSEF